MHMAAAEQGLVSPEPDQSRCSTMADRSPCTSPRRRLTGCRLPHLYRLLSPLYRLCKTPTSTQGHAAATQPQDCCISYALHVCSCSMPSWLAVHICCIQGCAAARDQGLLRGVLLIKADIANSVEPQACVTPAGGLQSAGCACAGPLCGCCAQPLHAGQNSLGAWLHCLHLLPVSSRSSAAASALPCRLAAHACRRVYR